jgi:hypothetical protein
LEQLDQDDLIVDGQLCMEHRRVWHLHQLVEHDGSVSHLGEESENAFAADPPADAGVSTHSSKVVSKITSMGPTSHDPSIRWSYGQAVTTTVAAALLPPQVPPLTCGV